MEIICTFDSGLVKKYNDVLPKTLKIDNGFLSFLYEHRPGTANSVDINLQHVLYFEGMNDSVGLSQIER